MTTIPQDNHVESAVLGEILVGKDASNHCLPLLNKDHFFNPVHKMIFQIICEMHEQGKSIDGTTVSSRISSMNLVTECGGIAYVMQLSTMSGMLLPEKYIEILEEKRRLRSLIEISSSIQSKALLNEDSEKVMNEAEDEIFKLKDVSNSECLTEMASNNAITVLERKKSGEKGIYPKTGLSVWDEVLGGLKPLFYVLASRAKMGKTALISQIARRFLSEKRPVLIFEKDMGVEMFITRMACCMASVCFSKYDLDFCSNSEIEDVEKALKFIKKSPIYVYAPSNFNISTFTSIIKNEKRIHGIEAVFLDHILNMNVGKDYRTGLTLASSRIRDSVEENKIPHVILAQLNREAHNCERPNASHVKEFDALYADCDVMNFLWSEKESVDVPPNELFPMKLTCGKNRYGSEFEEDIYFDRPLMKFMDKNKFIKI